MCSGFMAGLEGLGGRGLEEGTDGEVVEEDMFVGVPVSLGVAASVAPDCGLRAVLLPPGELAVAVLPSDVLLCPPSLAAAAFSAFLHFARRFWNQTCQQGEREREREGGG